MGHTIRQDWLTHVIVSPPISASVEGAQLLNGLGASYGGIDWKGGCHTMVSQAYGLV